VRMNESEYTEEFDINAFLSEVNSSSSSSSCYDCKKHV